LIVAALLVVIVALLVERAWREREHARERRRLTNAIVAKNGGELIALERAPRGEKRVSEQREKAMQLHNPLGYGD